MLNMMGNYFPYGSWGWNGVAAGLGSSFAAGIVFSFVAICVIVWITYWKFHAIWKAVHHNQKVWVVVFLLVNTLGILEILYIHYFSKYHKSS
jgi:methionyl-tRNA synthetase